MRLLIFSDNHKDRESVKKMLEQVKNPDRIFSLGDSEMREQELSELGIVGVKGNYPFEPKFPLDLFFDFDGVRIFLTHGHKYSVKLGLSHLMQKGYSLEADVVCFGHTHRAYLKDIEKCVYMNPGSLSKPKSGSSASYALIEITDKLIVFKIIGVDDEKVIQEYIKKR